MQTKSEAQECRVCAVACGAERVHHESHGGARRMVDQTLNRLYIARSRALAEGASAQGRRDRVRGAWGRRGRERDRMGQERSWGEVGRCADFAAKRGQKGGTAYHISRCERAWLSERAHREVTRDEDVARDIGMSARRMNGERRFTSTWRRR